MTITITYEAIDGCGATRSYKTLAGAQKFAQARVGTTPELGSFQAVSGDGVVVLWADGATLLELFPALAPKPAPKPAADGWEDEAAHELEAEAELGAVALASSLSAALAAIEAQRPAECEDDDCNLLAGHDGAHTWLPF